MMVMIFSKVLKTICSCVLWHKCNNHLFSLNHSLFVCYNEGQDGGFGRLANYFASLSYTALLTNLKDFPFVLKVSVEFCDRSLLFSFSSPLSIWMPGALNSRFSEMLDRCRFESRDFCSPALRTAHILFCSSSRALSPYYSRMIATLLTYCQRIILELICRW